MEYRAAPDIETEKMPENEIKMGNICQPLARGKLPKPKVVYISPTK
jgi:hypothetical protein